MVSVADARIDGVVPADFKEFFENWEKHGKEANPILNDVIYCETTPEGQKVNKIIVKTPWPIWNRCLISAFYTHFDQEDGSQVCLFSCIGNEEQKEKYFTEEDKKNYVLAIQHVGGWIVKPIKNESGEVIGSDMKYLNSSDACGNIPQFIQKSEGPKTAIDPILGTVKWARA